MKKDKTSFDIEKLFYGGLHLTSNFHILLTLYIIILVSR